MRFKHTFSVFIDNFKTTYKLLLYRLIVLCIAVCIYASIVFPLIGRITDTEAFLSVSEHLRTLFIKLADLDFAGIQSAFGNFKTALESLFITISQFHVDIIWGAIAIVFTFIVQNVFLGLGNYTVNVLIKDKMALQANSSFIGTLIKNLDKAFLYNIVYVPITFIYDLIVTIGFYFLFFSLIKTFILVQVFLYTTCVIFAITIKCTYTSDWLPAMIYGNMGPIKAMKYSFNKKGKDVSSVISTYLILVLMVLAINVCAVFFTLGSGLIITISTGNIVFASFAFVNYCQDNKIKYFTDKNTIIRHDTEKPISRVDFFRGNNE